METFTKEELMTIYFALDKTNDNLQFQKRYCRDKKVLANIEKNMKNISDLKIKIDAMGKELCTK